MSLRDAYIVIAEKRNNEQKLVNDLEYKILEYKRHIIYLDGILVTLKSSICQYCLGLGKEWVQHDQDDIKLENCPKCKGTGLPI